MELSANAQKILDLLEGLTLVELNALVKAIEEKFEVSAAAAVVAAPGAAAGGGGDEDAGGGSDTVSVELTEAGQQKINVIKVVKELLGLGLKEAKEIVEKAPTFVKENIKSDEADAIKAKLEEAGATVNFK